MTEDSRGSQPFSPLEEKDHDDYNQQHRENDDVKRPRVILERQSDIHAVHACDKREWQHDRREEGEDLHDLIYPVCLQGSENNQFS
jgi:hypothetical protein